MQVAKEIINQLGGNKFIAMTGAKNFGFDKENNTLSFKIMRNAAKVTHVSITLNSLDLYDLKFLNCGKSLRTIKEFKGIYNDMLQNLFTKTTGLYTSL